MGAAKARVLLSALTVSAILLMESEPSLNVIA